MPPLDEEVSRELNSNWLRNWSVLCIALFVVGAIFSFFSLQFLQQKLVERVALEQVQNYSSAMKTFRNIYSSEVVQRAKKYGMEIRHDYKDTAGAIPLPATLSLMLGNQIDGHGEHGFFHLYSDYPFPWRSAEETAKDPFEQEALNNFRQNNQGAFYRVESYHGQSVIRYAVPDHMTADCIACHNSHPDSPKTDWKVGDVRGVWEVMLPMDDAVATIQGGLREVWMLTAGIGGVALLFFGVINMRLRSHAQLITRKKMELRQEIEVRKRTEQEKVRLAKEAEVQSKRLSTIFNNVVEGIITIDMQEVVESFNPAAEKIFGYDGEEVVGKNVGMLIAGDFSEEEDNADEAQVKSNRKKIIGVNRELSGRKKDGSIFPMELVVTEVDIDNSRCFIATIRDITERKRIEKIQKEFVSTVSHELRTPLTSINGSLGLILGGAAGELPDKAAHLLSIANNNSERLIGLINDILDIEKISAGKMQFDFKAFNLIPVIQQAVEENRAYAEKLNVEFIFNSDIDEKELMVLLDKKRIEQVMSNLLSNAAKYSPKNEQVDISVKAEGNHARISVHDTGKGIPDEFKSSIFNKFSQADSSDTREKGGTGLGLNITQAIVHSHKGRISFDSEPGRGTTFYVDLPILKDGADVETLGEVDANKSLVLIAEDDIDISSLLAKKLSNGNYCFHQTYNYPEAVRHLKMYHYDAVILDLIIPDGYGASLLQHIKSNESIRSIPVVDIAAKFGEGWEGEGLNMIDWLEKPVNPEKLLASISAKLKHLPVNEARILQVEDDPSIIMIMESLLGRSHKISTATSLDEAQQLLKKENFDLILLNIALPDDSGLDLLTTLLSIKKSMPVIIFSSQEVPSSLRSQVVATLIKSKIDDEEILSQIDYLLTGNKKSA